MTVENVNQLGLDEFYKINICVFLLIQEIIYVCFNTYIRIHPKDSVCRGDKTYCTFGSRSLKVVARV